MYRYLLAGALFATGCQTGARMSYFGGQQVISHPRVLALSLGGSPVDPAGLRAVLGADYLGRLGEYGVGEGTYLGERSLPGAPPTTDAGVRALLPGLPDADVYLLTFPALGLMTDQNEVLCDQECGYHSYDPVTGAAYAVVADPGQAGCSCRAHDLTLQGDWDMGASHELAEAATDPAGLGWQLRAGSEIGDGCAWQSKEVDGHELQQLWSLKDGQCE